MLPPRDQAAFDRLVNRLDYPMLVVTAEADGERAGCLVGFATQCSIQPPPVPGVVVRRPGAGPLDAGDHVAFLVEPFAAAAAPVEGQLGFQDVRGLRPGHPP